MKSAFHGQELEFSAFTISFAADIWVFIQTLLSTNIFLNLNGSLFAASIGQSVVSQLRKIGGLITQKVLW